MKMDFTTPGYYYWFLPLAMVLYFFILRGNRDQRIILLVAISYLFFWMASGWLRNHLVHKVQAFWASEHLAFSFFVDVWMTCPLCR